jgi:hypothetical protein
MSILDQIRIAQRDAGEAVVAANLERLGLAPKSAPTLDELRANAFKARDAAEKAWYALFCEAPVGDERTWASEVYENIRRATRDTSVRPNLPK